VLRDAPKIVPSPSFSAHNVFVASDVAESEHLSLRIARRLKKLQRGVGESAQRDCGWPRFPAQTFGPPP
jgi:hypothetical protein